MNVRGAVGCRGRRWAKRGRVGRAPWGHATHRTRHRHVARGFYAGLLDTHDTVNCRASCGMPLKNPIRPSEISYPHTHRSRHAGHPRSKMLQERHVDAATPLPHKGTVYRGTRTKVQARSPRLHMRSSLNGTRCLAQAESAVTTRGGLFVGDHLLLVRTIISFRPHTLKVLSRKK
jgi:hypothetical protein